MNNIKGQTWKFGDNIDTDKIVPGQFLKLELNEAAEHVMEGEDPEFKSKVKPGDILVAGKNFGCGSSREFAPAALKEAGISAVISVFFARIFFRNAINIGLPAIECPDASKINEGDEIEIILNKGQIKNITQNETYYSTLLPDEITNILENGGLMNVLKKKMQQHSG